MLTQDQAKDIRTRNNALMLWVDSVRGKNGWASYKPEDKPASVPDWKTEDGDYGCGESPETCAEGTGSHMPERLGD